MIRWKKHTFVISWRWVERRGGETASADGLSAAGRGCLRVSGASDREDRRRIKELCREPIARGALRTPEREGVTLFGSSGSLLSVMAT